MHYLLFKNVILFIVMLFFILITANLLLRKNKDDYFIEPDTKALLLGSSRVGHYDKEQVSSKIGGGKVRIFSVPGAPYKILYKYLIHASAHSSIEYVLINLDFLSANKIEL